MFSLFAIGAVIALCALLWRVAIYAFPVFIGLTAGFWSLSAGAGVGALFVGLLAGGISWEFAKYAIRRGRDRTRFIVTGLLALSAAYMGFEIVWQIFGLGGCTTVWRVLFGTAAGLAAGGTAMARLAEAASSEFP